MRFQLRYLLCFLIVAGCSKPPAPSAEAPRAKIDACALLTPEEVAATQGATVSAAKSVDKSSGGVATSLCAFALPNAADSVNLTVSRQIDPTAPGDRKRLWAKTFLEGKSETGEEEREGKEEKKPERIAGLGDDAFWVGGQFGGTLHVLKGDSWIQLSVGGPGDQARKLEQMKTLAAKVVGRL